MTNRTEVKRKSDRELVVTRRFDAPARLVYQAWTKSELFARWWVPRSLGMSLLSCALDMRTGGGYRLEFDRGGGASMAFFGTYLEVIPNARIVWTNEESRDGPVTTLTFEEKDGKTLLTLSELYPSKEAADEGFEGMGQGMPESLDQLDELLGSLGG